MCTYKENKIQIVFITPQLPPLHGGIGATIKNITNVILKYEDHKVTILIPNPPGNFKRSILENFQEEFSKFSSKLSIFFLPSQPIPRFINSIVDGEFDKMAGFIENYRKFSIDAILSSIKPDVICVFDPIALAGIPFLFGYGQVLGKKYAKDNKIPLIAYYHSHYIGALRYYSFFYRTMFRIFLRYLTRKHLSGYDRVIVFSNDIAYELNRLGIRNTSILSVEGLRFYTMPKPIDKKNVVVPTIIFFGRLMKEKNIKTMTKIFIDLHKKNPNFSVIIIGEGPEKAKMQSELKHLAHVMFFNWMDKVELYETLCRADIFINCTSFETLCLSMTEAMYFKCVPVTYYKGGHVMFIDNFVNGFLCRTQYEYIKYLNILIKKPNLMKIMGANARKKILESFNANQNVGKFLTFLENQKKYLCEIN